MSIILPTCDVFSNILCLLIGVLFTESKQQTNVKQTLDWIYIQFCYDSDSPFRHMILNQFKASLSLLHDDLYATICPIRAFFCVPRPREYETVYVRIPFAQLSPLFRWTVRKYLRLNPSLHEETIFQDSHEFVFSIDPTKLNRSPQNPNFSSICVDLSEIYTPTKIYAFSYCFLDIKDVTHIFMDDMYQLMVELQLEGIVTMNSYKKMGLEPKLDKVYFKR